ncbi:MAG: RHS domain-containing protein, partial [Acidobacteriota bacterium]|nr:RHS domain-containing protein [Acidobacteriota bacterium]
SFPSGDSVFVDDSIPPGAVPTGTWNWDTTEHASGTQSFRLFSTTNADVSFDGASTPMTPAAGDKLFIYVMVDPCEPPKEILVRWSPISSAFRGARWGDDLLAYGSASDRVYSGRVPQGGSWVRLEVPASAMNAVGVNLTGLAVSVYGGRAWFDRAGKTSCTTPVASAPTFGANEVVWFDDNTPAGADTHGGWTWDTTQKASGAQSTTRPTQRGYSLRWFSGATATLTTSGNAGDELFAYALIDPCDPPLEIMIGWADPNWSHWAYWGEDLINSGTPGASRFYMGSLPAGGQWVKLTMPVATMGFTGAISGFNISLYSGKAWFDRIGKNTGGFAALRRRGNEPQYASLRSMASSGETPPTLTRYSLYTPELNLLAETQLTSSATPTIQYEYAWFGGQPIAQFTGTTTYWTFNDHLGTPVVQTDSSAAIAWRAEYEPYGKVSKMRVGGNAHQPLRFPGQEDEQLDSGTNGANDRRYNILRWYRSNWGKFTQFDPIGNTYWPSALGSRIFSRAPVVAVPHLANPARVHPFSYAASNPLSNVDPRGLRVQTRGCDPPASCLETNRTRPCCDCHDVCFATYNCSAERDWAETASYLASIAGPLSPPIPPRAVRYVQLVGHRLLCKRCASELAPTSVPVARDRRHVAAWEFRPSVELKMSRIIVFLSFLVAFWGCSHCVNERLSTVTSQTAGFSAELEMRRCGSFEGWAVSVWGKDLPRRQLLLIRMPPPVAVEDAGSAVTIRWIDASTLVVRAPSWVKTYVAEKTYGPVHLQYDINPMAYPR